MHETSKSPFFQGITAHRVAERVERVLYICMQMSFLQYCAYFARFESLFMQIGRYKSQWILCSIFLRINNSHGVLVPCYFFWIIIVLMFLDEQNIFKLQIVKCCSFHFHILCIHCSLVACWAYPASLLWKPRQGLIIYSLGTRSGLW